MRLEGLVAVVTGGASGLGLATVRRLLRNVCKVGIWDFNEKLGTSMANELGPSAHFAKCDVSSQQSVAEALESTIKAFSRVDVLVNCAGVMSNHPIYSEVTGVHPMALFEREIKINLYGTFNTCRLVAERMAKQQPKEGERGVIINTASISGIEGTRGQVAYGASKGAVIGMTLPMARDLGSLGIRVATIAPALFSTPLAGPIPAEALKALGNASALGRVGVPDEYAHMVQFIIENTYLTGEVLRLDAGTRLPHL